MFITINGQRHDLWQAVDQHGNVLDILVTSRHGTQAAIRFFRELLTRLEYVPRVLITGKLASYAAARRRVLRSVEHRQPKYLNNRAENSHQPTRARERAIKKVRRGTRFRVIGWGGWATVSARVAEFDTRVVLLAPHGAGVELGDRRVSHHRGSAR